MRIICQKFAAKVNINVDSKIYLYNNKPLSINQGLDKTLGEQINTNENGDKEIVVLDDPDKEFTIKLHYEGEVKEMKYKQGDKKESIFAQIGQYFSLQRKSFFALCNGVLIGGDDELNTQLSTQITTDSNEINLLIESEDLENSLNENENNNENIINKQKSLNKVENKEDKMLIERKKKVIFLLKIYLKLIIQIVFISFFVWLGFYKNYKKIFIEEYPFLSIFSEIVFIFIFSLFIFKKKLGNIFTTISIILYVPFTIVFCFIISKIVDKEYIITILVSILLDFFSVIIFILIFKRYEGYGFTFVSLILNAILLTIYYFFFCKEYDLELYYNLANFASIFIIYILFFTTIAKKKIDFNESLVAIYYFDYYIFAPFVVIILLIILIPVIFLLIFLMFALFLVVLMLIAYLGTPIILIIMIIKVFCYFFANGKKNTNKKIN